MNLFNSAKMNPSGYTPLTSSLHNVQDDYQNPANRNLKSDSAFLPSYVLSVDVPENASITPEPIIPPALQSGPDYVLFILALMAFLTFLRSYANK